jgi:hypothetical protein
MTTFSIQTKQQFNVAYEIEAATPSEAWELLTANAELNCEPSAVSWYLTCVDQQPSGITATMEESTIEELLV